ncbi:MAG TPA: YHS domain-containing protein [Gammaproteobacteria bacterium]|nr:YHS domain-containing protein [Gammaproteobacteria bacterium]
MGGLGSLLIFAILFFLMMRYGCGAHMMHGRHESEKHKPKKFIDPVCNMAVKEDEGYGKMHDGELYRFCTKSCLNKFDDEPGRYLNKKDADEHAM